MSKTNRIEYIDILKGIGILTMILGHLVNQSFFDIQVAGEILIYSFHMPMFFIISGYCFKERQNKEYILKKAKALLIPYVVSYFGLVIPTAFFTNNMDIKEILATFVFPNAADSKLFIGGAIWFFPALFVSNVIFNATRNVIKNNLLFGMTSIGFMVLGFVISDRYGKLPGLINQSLIAIGFIYFGYMMKKMQKKFDLTKLNPVILLSLSILNVVLIAYNGKESIYSIQFGQNKIVYLVNGILGTVILWNFVRVFYKRTRKNIFSKIITSIGANSKYYVMFSQVCGEIVIAILGTNLNAYTQIPIFILSVILNFAIAYLFSNFKKIGTKIVKKNKRLLV